MGSAGNFLAFDLGAESGRVLLGRVNGGRLESRELHRFPTRFKEFSSGLHWDVIRFFEEMVVGLHLAAKETGGELAGLAVDTWGVDFALLAPDGSLLGLPWSYRDPRTENAAERFYKKLDRDRLYAITGVQELSFNTLFQLQVMVEEQSPLLCAAESLLFMPDLCNYFLTGNKVSEVTIASTSQLFDLVTGRWSEEVLGALGLRLDLLPEVVAAGSVMGSLRAGLAQDAGLGTIPVIAGAGHDTAAAVAAIPALNDDWAFISCGTWSLVGVELAQPCRSKAALAGNFTNEGGVAGTTRFLRNVMGLWLLQECRRAWTGGEGQGYAELVAAALSEPTFSALVDPDWPGFLNPPDMPAAISRYCQLTGQQPPEGNGAFTRVICESLALKYRMVLEAAVEITGKRISRLHLVGGGVHNELLCQFTADAIGLPVLAGPAEATAVGNLLVQAMAVGQFHDLNDLRTVAAATFTPRVYQPGDQKPWDKAATRLAEFGRMI